MSPKITIVPPVEVRSHYHVMEPNPSLTQSHQSYSSRSKTEPHVAIYDPMLAYMQWYVEEGLDDHYVHTRSYLLDDWLMRMKFWPNEFRALFDAWVDENVAEHVFLQRENNSQNGWRVCFLSLDEKAKFSNWVHSWQRKHKFTLALHGKVIDEDLIPWINENIRGNWRRVYRGQEHDVWIRDEHEATLFKLRWSDHLTFSSL